MIEFTISYLVQLLFFGAHIFLVGYFVKPPRWRQGTPPWLHEWEELCRVHGKNPLQKSGHFYVWLICYTVWGMGLGGILTYVVKGKEYLPLAVGWCSASFVTFFVLSFLGDFLAEKYVWTPLWEKKQHKE